VTEQRNPYSAPTAPLHPDESAVSSGNAIHEGVGEYGGFWRRVGAQILDGLIVLPLSVILYFGMNYSRLFYLYYLVPSLAFAAVYGIYLVKRYGGTPGKLILKMRVTMVDGAPVTTAAATIRYSVILILSGLSSLAVALAALSFTDAEFLSMGYLQKMLALNAAMPGWNVAVTSALYVWIVASAIVMLSNKKRRALHDFLAKTLVVRTD
jgi:uncharacterized RDD family membrane protein YckC